MRTGPIGFKLSCQVSESRASRSLGWLARRATVGVVAAWLVTLLGFAGPLHWFADAMNHTRWHVAWACLLATIVLWTAGFRRWLAVAACCVLVNVVVVAPWNWYLPSPSGGESIDTAKGPTVELLFWNIHEGNQNIETVTRLIERFDPDIVALLELHPRHTAELDTLRQEYATFRERPRGDSFGLGVYSRYPMTWTKGGGEPPEIRGRVHVEDATLEVWAMHVLPPLGGTYLGERNQQFVNLGQQIAARPDDASPVVLGGDFNITPWCAEFRDLVSTSGLVDSRQGDGYQATWPSKLHWAGIPIDHVLVDPRLEIIDRQVLHGDGVSDHAAVLVTIRVPARKRPG